MQKIGDGKILETKWRGQWHTTPCYGAPHVAKQKQDNQLEHTYCSYVRIWAEAFEDLPEAMNEREKWRERVRDICASSKTWYINKKKKKKKNVLYDVGGVERSEYS